MRKIGDGEILILITSVKLQTAELTMNAGRK